MVREKPIEEVLSERAILLEKYYDFHKEPSRRWDTETDLARYKIRGQLYHALKNQLHQDLTFLFKNSPSSLGWR